jgi:lysozyme
VTDDQRKAIVVSLAASLAVPAEGLHRWAYYDPPGILTVCRGHTGADVRKDHLYSLVECASLFSADMLKAIATVERCMPGLPVNVLAAFADAVFNLGPKIACDTKSSTPARALARKDFTAACHALRLYNKARVAGVLIVLPGLDTRRAREEARCLTPEDVEIT